MHGKNPKKSIENGDGNILDVQEIFATFQGEGLYAGTPAVFVRLGGCNLACDFCDAEFENYTAKSLDAIITEVQNLAKNSDNIRCKHLVVITGGEPLRQPIERLCNQLVEYGFKVQIETNGTIYRELNQLVDIVCSPKNTGNGYKKIRKDLLPKITAFKFIISQSHPLYQNIAEVGQSEYDIPVYMQPMDEYDSDKNAANLEYVKNMVLDNNYILSIQLQKIVGVQ